MDSKILSNSSIASERNEQIFDMPSCHSEATQPTQYSFRTLQKPLYNDVHEIEYAYSDSDTTEERQTYQAYPSTSTSEYEASDFESTEIDDINNSQIYVQSQVALPSNPRNFGQHFPSRDRLLIRHDDATIDGNMNLRVDSHYMLPSGRTMPLTLFHMRMHDLKTRDFSLRRYCRDSGREVCHSMRKYHRGFRCENLGFQTKISDAFKRFRNRAPLRSSQEGFSDEKVPDRHLQHPTNVIKLEFANYTHIQMTRVTSISSHLYRFEYWGKTYHWKRQLDDEGNKAFRLFCTGSEFPCAHIVQDVLTLEEMDDEKDKGGWVPPCSMWIVDDTVIDSPDVAE
jgi:hypothetical protein